MHVQMQCTTCSTPDTNSHMTCSTNTTFVFCMQLQGFPTDSDYDTTAVKWYYATGQYIGNYHFKDCLNALLKCNNYFLCIGFSELLEIHQFWFSVAVLASFPGPARSSLAVRNLRRGPGLVHHVMSATVVFLCQHNVCRAVQESWNKSSAYDRL